MDSNKGKIILSIMTIIVVGQTNGLNVEEDIRNSTKFSVDLYRAMFNQNENTIVSPFSFRILLSALYQSVTGSSETELREKVYLGDKEETFNSQREYLNRYATSSNIKIVNKIFLKNEGTLKPSFLTVIQGLKGQIEQVDFNQKEATTNKMNNWVEEQTNGLIKNLVSSDAVTPDTAMFLINTLYFKARWETPFGADERITYPFTGIDGVTTRVKALFDRESRKVADLDTIKARVMEIPYTAESNFVFWVMLPNEDSNIINLKNSLSYDIIKEAIQKFVEYEYDVVIPEFQVETSVDGVDLLKQLGINSIFQNFECYMLENNLPLKVDDIKQKSKIIVNSQGTEVASASYLKVIDKISAPSFKVNRPFIYMILTADTHEPVFMGHYSKP